MNNTKSYCSKCKRWLPAKKFWNRTDRDCRYSWCIKCCERTPLHSRVLVNEDWVEVLDKPERTREYPLVEDRGYGVTR